MPRPTNSKSYPTLFWRIAEAFQTGDATQPIQIDCTEIYTAARGETPEGCAQKLRFRWYGFKKSLEKLNHPLTPTMHALELLVRGPLLIIQLRDTNDFSRAVEAALERQGVRMFTPPQIFEIQQMERMRLRPNEPLPAFDYGKARVDTINRHIDDPQDHFPGGSTDAPTINEEQVMRDGVASTKKFEAVMAQLGFTTDAEALAPPKARAQAPTDPDVLPNPDGSIPPID